MSSANVGTAYMTISPKFDGLSRSVNSAIGKVDGTAGGGKFAGSFSSGFSLKAGAVIGAVSSVANRAIDMVSNSMGSAISRVDTIANFPKVMQNLGYGADEAQSSIDRLASGIDGLPTSLDGIVSMTQQLAPLAGGLENATTLSLALNDAFLAGGASTADQTRAMQQYSQMLAKGSVDLQSWRTLQEVMPGQLNQVSEALLGAGKNSNDLYEAMKNGTVSFDDFNNAIIKLDQEGSGAFASFQEQAYTATQGIGTAMENFQNRVSKAIASVINAIGQENISGFINSITESFGPAASVVADFITSFKEAFELPNGGEWTSTLASDIKSILPTLDEVKQGASDLGSHVADVFGQIIEFFAQAGHTLFENFQLSGIADSIGGLAQTFMDLFEQTNFGITKAGDALHGFDVITQGVFGAGAQLVQGFNDALNTEYVQQAIQYMADAFDNLRSVLEPFYQTVLVPLGNTIFPLIGSAAGKLVGVLSNIYGTVVNVLAAAIDAITNFVSFVGSAVEAIQSSPVVAYISGQINAIGEIFNGVIDVIAGVIGTISGLIEGLITGDFTNFQAGVQLFVDGIASIFNGVSDAITNIVVAVVGVVNAINDATNGALSNLVGFVMSIPDQIVGFFTSLPSQIASIFSSAASDGGSNMLNIVGFVNSIPSQIVGFFTSLPSQIGSLFQSAVSAAQGQFNALVSFAASIPGRIVGFFAGIGSRITSALGSIHFPSPHVEWSHIDVMGTNVSLPNVKFYAKGGRADSAQMAVFGESAPEVATPLTKDALRPWTEGVAEGLKQRGGMASDNSAVVAEIRALHEELGEIIARFTPVMSEEDFNRQARRAVVYA